MTRFFCVLYFQRDRSPFCFIFSAGSKFFLLYICRNIDDGWNSHKWSCTEKVTSYSCFCMNWFLVVPINRSHLSIVVCRLLATVSIIRRCKLPMYRYMNAYVNVLQTAINHFFRLNFFHQKLQMVLSICLVVLIGYVKAVQCLSM